MAVKTILVDDFTGEEIPNSENSAPDPVFLEIDNKRYRLDLSTESIELFKTTLGDFWKNATEDKPLKTEPKKSATASSSDSEESSSRAPQNNTEREALMKLDFSRAQLFVIAEELVKAKKLPKPVSLTAAIPNTSAEIIRKHIEDNKIERIEKPEDVKPTPALTAALKASEERVKKMQAARKK